MNMPAKIEDVGQAAITPMGMIELAVKNNAPIDQLERLMALQERHEENEARKAFVQALSDFKNVGLIITKDKHVKYGNTEYKHATLGNICNILGAELSKFGLSYRWNTEQVDNRIKVTCVLMHTMGHSESISLEASADTSGSKNSIQAIGSAVSYLERYTLLAITGTATQEQDDDGQGFGMEDVMDESTVVNYLAKMDEATNQKELLPIYLEAIETATAKGDTDAAKQFTICKARKLEAFKK